MADISLAWWVRPLNATLDVTKLFQIDSVGLSWPKLENAARRLSGVSVELDDAFRAEMRIFLDAALSDDGLTALGKISIRQMIIRRLVTRLRLTHVLQQHPEIDDLPVRSPLFIVGLPRTGTTLLHRLLACDSANRAPLLWQLLNPCHSFDTSPAELNRHIRRTQRYVRLTAAATPGMRAIHDVDAHQPEECHYLLPHSFHYHALFPVPQYLQWLDRRDFRPDYQYFKRQLQVMQWRQPGRRWVLKSPVHLGSLDALLSVFPDARIIQTHRDPATVLASFCSLVETVALLANRNVDRDRIGRDWLAIWTGAMSRAVHVRHAAADRRCFVDVHYDNFVADPVGTVEDVYRDLGENLSPEGRGRMSGYLDRDRHGAHGTHRYSLERYGLTESAVTRAFADYRTCFDMR